MDSQSQADALVPRFKLILLCNTVPRIPVTDDEFQGRIRETTFLSTWTAVERNNGDDDDNMKSITPYYLTLLLVQEVT